jgi:hypothetical protein
MSRASQALPSDRVDALLSNDSALRWEVKGRRHAAFTSDFDYRSGT